MTRAPLERELTNSALHARTTEQPVFTSNAAANLLKRNMVDMGSTAERRVTQYSSELQEMCSNIQLLGLQAVSLISE